MAGSFYARRGQPLPEPHVESLSLTEHNRGPGQGGDAMAPRGRSFLLGRDKTGLQLWRSRSYSRTRLQNSRIARRLQKWATYYSSSTRIRRSSELSRGRQSSGLTGLCRVSSRLDKSVGSKCLTDGSPETCWTSQQVRDNTTC